MKNLQSAASALETWLAQRLHGREQAVPYHLSPVRRDLRMAIYAEYDDAVERDRRFTDVELPRPPPTLSVDDWALAPLGVHLARHLGRPDPDPDRRLWGWAAADWAEVRRLASADSDFAAGLSRPRAASLALLEAWWTAAYCEPELPAAARAFFDARADVETRGDPLEARVASGPESMTDTSLYHSSCFGLFLAEMHPRTWFPHMPSSVRNLQIVRRLTASQCLLQRVAYTAMSRRPASPAAPYPRRVEWSAAPTALDSADLAAGPYHLWDVERRATVVVADLGLPAGRRPEYLCVSHTWGRWRTRTDARVPGVPWPVPENTLYDVRALPDQLHLLGARYVWLDLFCIPQDRGERALVEIANQASIFRGAARCVAWLHDVDAWRAVRAALEWLALRYLAATSTRQHDLVSAALADVAAVAAAPAELLSRADGHDGSTGDVAGVHPSSWFSSLWTLQECALCPDLELCSRTWDLLRDRWGAPIPLRSLMDFANDVKLHLWNEVPPDVPLAVALYRTGETVHGVILEEIAWGPWDRRYLTKIGRFSVRRGELPAATAVNWEMM